MELIMIVEQLMNIKVFFNTFPSKIQNNVRNIKINTYKNIYRHNKYMTNDIDKLIVFTDGSCMKKSDGIKCGYGVYFPNGEIGDVSKKYTFGHPTNQRAELYAIYKAIKLATTETNFNTLHIYTDSNYSIQSLTLWIKAWKKNNWKTSKNQDVLNQDIIKKIDKYMTIHKNKILFYHVRSHTGNTDYNSVCNDYADKLATRGALL